MREAGENPAARRQPTPSALGHLERSGPITGTPSALTIHADVACPVCGCVCDDLQLQVVGDRIDRAHGACKLAEPWLMALNDSRLPAATVDGVAAATGEALSRAAEILSASRNPLIFGLSRSSTPGQRAAVDLAERLRGNIDTTASVGHGPSILAMQQVGESTCTLGEVRHRADLVIFWGADPAESHPRHCERYSVEPRGRFVPGGRADRTIVVVDTRRTATAQLADIFLQLEPEQDFEAIWTLRQLVAGQRPGPAADAPVALDRLEDLAQRMKGCRYGALFFGFGLGQRPSGHVAVQALLSLVTDLNAYTRFTARGLGLPGALSGAESVLCWRTGYPFAVNFSRGYPRYNPGEYSAGELLARGEVDACLLVGSESTGLLPQRAQAALRQIPTIVLDYPHIATAWEPTVRITTAVYGVHVPGTAYRMDDVPVPLKAVVPSPYPADHEVLDAILRHLDTGPTGPAAAASEKRIG